MTKKLNILYYFFYCLYVAVIALFAYGLDMSTLALDPMSKAGQAIQGVVIMYILLSIPLSLFLFKKYMKKVSQIEDEAARDKAYLRAAIIRMVLICLGAVLAIAAFYLLRQYTSMLWCAGIALIAQFFCKPNAKKIYMEENDLREDDPRMGDNL